MVNGRDVTPSRVGAPVNRNREIADGDVVPLSGPVPYSYGYGAPVVWARAGVSRRPRSPAPCR